MFKKLFLIVSIFVNLPLCFIQALTIQILNKKTIGSMLIIKLKFNLTPDELLLKDFLQFSTDDPNFSTTSWNIKQETVSHYLSSIKNSKRMFAQSFTAVLKLTTTQETEQKIPCHLHISYFKHMHHKTIPGICMLAIP